MNKQLLVIQGQLTDLNTYVRACRGSKYTGNDVAKEENERVAWECKKQKLKPIGKTPLIVYHWFCKNKKKDKSNVAFSKKFIEDGLQQAGILDNDGWDYIGEFEDKFAVDKNERVEVTIYEYGDN